MLLVYCDTGAFTVALARLERQGKLTLHQFKYENPNQNIQRGAIPSNIYYEDLKNYNYDGLKNVETPRDLTYDQLAGINSRFDEVLSVVGVSNRHDAQHIDSAQMTGCTVFLTSDKGDIWSKRDRLYQLFNLRIFLVPLEYKEFLSLIESAD